MDSSVVVTIWEKYLMHVDRINFVRVPQEDGSSKVVPNEVIFATIFDTPEQYFKVGSRTRDHSLPSIVPRERLQLIALQRNYLLTLEKAYDPKTQMYANLMAAKARLDVQCEASGSKRSRADSTIDADEVRESGADEEHPIVASSSGDDAASTAPVSADATTIVATL